MIKIDIGSGYNPSIGYKTCDVNSYCDYYMVDDIPDYYVDVIRLRNVIHHIRNLDEFISSLIKKLKPNGKLLIIDCNEENFKTNVILDKLWYRFVNYR